MTLIDIPRLLGERSPTASRVRVTIRNKLLLRRALARTDHQGIRDTINTVLSEAIELRDALKDNPKDEQKRRQNLALIAEAVCLASDVEHAEWLREKCTDLLWISSKRTPLLPLALKAFGPHDYDGDAPSCRSSDRKVSRDNNAIIRTLSPDVLPPDLVHVWNQPGRGINASSRPVGAVNGKQNPSHCNRITLTMERKFHERLTRQADQTKMISLITKRGTRFELSGVVADPQIVQAATRLIKQRLAKGANRVPKPPKYPPTPTTT